MAGYPLPGLNVDIDHDGSVYTVKIFTDLRTTGRPAATAAGPDLESVLGAALVGLIEAKHKPIYRLPAGEGQPDSELARALLAILAAVNCNYDPLTIKAEGLTAQAESALRKAGVEPYPKRGEL